MAFPFMLEPYRHYVFARGFYDPTGREDEWKEFTIGGYLCIPLFFVGCLLLGMQSIWEGEMKQCKDSEGCSPPPDRLRSGLSLCQRYHS
ncbi:hypothetical protein NQZ68_023271 [Dissostichus eleginoides]|nr:hypothetical protein NQZ68_023271 [Dissostichus eleginoides]